MSAVPTSSTIKKIVPIFSGGGTRLTAHIGVLSAMEALNIEFDNVVGISGGSIVASLYCTGKTLDDIMQLAIDTDFRKFRGYSVYRLLKDGGLSSGDTFEQWMDQQLEGKTFSEADYNLHILATDVNGGGPVIFSKQVTPDMKISQAIRYSMSIPLVFSFKQYKSHLLVDGAILSEDALFQDWAGDGTPNLCFRLKGQQVTTERKSNGYFHLPEYVFMLIRTFMTAISREYVHAQNWHNTVVVNTGDISAVDFKLSPQQKRKLFDIGFETGLTYIPAKLKMVAATLKQSS